MAEHQSSNRSLHTLRMGVCGSKGRPKADCRCAGAPSRAVRREREPEDYFGIHLSTITNAQGDFVICYLDYCDASSSRRSAAEYSTERKAAFGGARSDSVDTSGLHWRPSCDSPCGPCRSNACCSRLDYFRGSYRLAGRQRPPSQRVQQGQRSEEVN